MTLSAMEYKAFLRNDLYTFTERAFRELNPKAGRQPPRPNYSPHH
jgi:hypothetical protein